MLTIARDHKGEVVFVWTEFIKDQDLLIAKVKAAYPNSRESNNFGVLNCRKMLTSALRALVNNLFKKSFYRK